ncbi:arylesterase [Acidipila sp. EB88]|uniref:arylesterase n=1 Tax=Acidipila sp. EB88 TaxID=2305226 RepID=UPI000F5EE0C2|nr:arylesterase [Acidipila sp. EB88]RRA47626.1 arylesterase [Acidipila sp. EB88]
MPRTSFKATAILKPLAALLAWCTACSVQAAAPATIVFFGDSLTAGTGSVPGSTYPDFLGRDLQAQGYRATIINQGVAGDTTEDGLRRIGAVLAAHPDIVVLELGANDAIYDKPIPGIVANLNTIIASLQQAHIRVLVAGVVMPPNLQAGAAYVAQFNPIYSSVAAANNVALVPSLLNNVYGVAGLMSSDYIHPNSAGYEHVALNVLPYLEPMLTR